MLCMGNQGVGGVIQKMTMTQFANNNMMNNIYTIVPTSLECEYPGISQSSQHPHLGKYRNEAQILPIDHYGRLFIYYKQIRKSHNRNLKICKTIESDKLHLAYKDWHMNIET